MLTRKRNFKIQSICKDNL